MRIAVWHNLPSGGGARALNTHLQGLLGRGHEIEIWSCNPTADGFIDVPDGVQLHRVPLKRKDIFTLSENIDSFFFKKDENMRNMEIHCQQCADEIHAGNFDVLFANSCYYYAAPFISRFVQLPSVLYLGEPFRYLYESQPYMPWFPPGVGGKIQWLRRSYWNLFFKDLWHERRMRVQMREERLNAEAVGTLLVNSIFSSESCAKAYNRSGEVCYLGIDTAIFRPKKKRPSAPYVVGVGNLYFNKNPLLAIDAVAAIPESKRPALLWVANMKDENLYKEATASAATKNVRFEIKEMISDDELVILLSNAICMVYTSHLEPFGLAPLEANACGTPVVAVAQGGVRESIIDGKNGLLCPPKAAEIAVNIERLIDYPERQAEMGRVALHNVQQNWTLEASTDRIETALTKAKNKRTL